MDKELERCVKKINNLYKEQLKKKNISNLEYLENMDIIVELSKGEMI